MKTVLAALSASAALFAAAPALADIVALQFHADWCGKCKQLQPKLDTAADAFDEAGVEIVQLDFTDRSDDNIAAQRTVADGAGAADVFDEYAPRTGFVKLVDTDTGDEVGELTAGMSDDEIREALAEAS